MRAKGLLLAVLLAVVSLLAAGLIVTAGLAQQGQPAQPPGVQAQGGAPGQQYPSVPRTYARLADLGKIAGESVWVQGIAGNRVDTSSKTTRVYMLHDRWGASIRVRTEQDWATNGVTYDVRGTVTKDPEFSDYVLVEQQREALGAEPGKTGTGGTTVTPSPSPPRRLDPLMIAGIALIALAVILGTVLIWQVQRRKRAQLALQEQQERERQEAELRMQQMQAASSVAPTAAPGAAKAETMAGVTVETWAKVEVVRGPDAGKTFPLMSRESIVGRASGEVSLSDQSVSRDHGKIVQKMDGQILYIDDSRNGSRVNGEAVHKAQKVLGDEAEIEVGTSLLKFVNLRRAAPAGGPGVTRMEPAPVVDMSRAPTMISLGADIKAVEGPDAGKTFPLSKATTTIGRQPDRDIQLTDEYASRKHATISLENGKFILRNESSQGTSVNDSPVQERELTGGERIKMGRTVLEFVKK